MKKTSNRHKFLLLLSALLSTGITVQATKSVNISVSTFESLQDKDKKDRETLADGFNRYGFTGNATNRTTKIKIPTSSKEVEHFKLTLANYVTAAKGYQELRARKNFIHLYQFKNGLGKYVRIKDQHFEKLDPDAKFGEKFVNDFRLLFDKKGFKHPSEEIKVNDQDQIKIMPKEIEKINHQQTTQSERTTETAESVPPIPIDKHSTTARSETASTSSSSWLQWGKPIGIFSLATIAVAGIAIAFREFTKTEKKKAPEEENSDF